MDYDSAGEILIQILQLQQATQSYKPTAPL
jgi:hypothetical protein